MSSPVHIECREDHLSLPHNLMVSSELVILVDGADPAIEYGRGWANTTQGSTWFGGSAVFATGNSHLNYSFHGTSISVVGVVNAPTKRWSPTVQIDNSSSKVGYDDFPNVYRAWYTSPTLSDHPHNISLGVADVPFVYVDYLTITAGETTPLEGHTVIVDDSDTALIYTGDWKPQSGQIFSSAGFSKQIAYRNTTHWSNTKGDSLRFGFTGSSVSVYGVLQQHAGSLSTLFTVDGSSPVTYFVEFNGSTEKYDQINNRFFHTDLEPGNHTLALTVTDVAGDQSFSLDYILYNASFSNLASKPDFIPSTSSEANTPVGVIVGPVVGGLALLVILCFLVYWKKRRGRKQTFPKEEIDLTGGYSLTSEPASIPIMYGVASSKKDLGPRPGSIASSQLTTPVYHQRETPRTRARSTPDTPLTTQPFISRKVATLPRTTSARPLSAPSASRPRTSSTNMSHKPYRTSAANSGSFIISSPRPISVLPANLSETSDPGDLSIIPEIQSQGHDRPRTQEYRNMVAQLEGVAAVATASDSLDGDDDIIELRRRIEVLIRENTRLQAERTVVSPPSVTRTRLEEPPPAYDIPSSP